ncbi:hypothetical protein D3C81_1270380 [compost metagenome]
MPSIDFDINKFSTPIINDQKKERLYKLKNELQLLSTKATDTGKQVKRLVSVIDGLADKVRNGQISSLSKRLTDVNKLWTSVTRQKSFEVLYSFTLQQHINNYMKHVADIVETHDIRKKSVLVVKHLGGLVKIMDSLTPKLIELLRESTIRIEIMIDELGDVR